MRSTRDEPRFCYWAATRLETIVGYDEHVPIADTLYDEHLRELEREGLT